MKKINQNNNLPHISRLTTQPAFGFTLVEMIVSIAIFSFVMIAVMSVLLSVIDANHKAQGMKTTINNLSLTLESIARNLRVGTKYGCDGVVGRDCPSNPTSNLIFTDYQGISTSYCLVGGSIRVARGATPCDGAASEEMTSREITIDRLNFYVSGASNEDELQPKILISVGGVVSINTAVGAKTKTSSRFDIQTTVSERYPDVPRN